MRIFVFEASQAYKLDRLLHLGAPLLAADAGNLQAEFDVAADAPPREQRGILKYDSDVAAGSGLRNLIQQHLSARLG